MVSYRFSKRIFEMAYSHLLSFDGVEKHMIDEHLNHWKQGKRDSINNLLRGMLNSVQNKRGMWRAIGNLENLKPYLENFEPARIVEKYGGNWREDWEKLFEMVQNSYTPPGRMAIDIPQNSWTIFCKAIISASNFLSRFSNIEEFDEFVSRFYLNEYTRLALPLLLDKEIFGLGFALACDFLKENGYPKFVKPDSNIMAIFKGIGISHPKADDYQVFKDVVKFSESIDEVPYVVDKLFWLVGSGNFYLSKESKEIDAEKYKKIKRKISARRDYFIGNVRKEPKLQET